jgi:hypothetical protein
MAGGRGHLLLYGCWTDAPQPVHEKKMKTRSS